MDGLTRKGVESVCIYKRLYYIHRYGLTRECVVRVNP